MSTNPNKYFLWSEIRELILSNVGFLLGLVGVFMALIPFFGFGNSILYNSIFPILFGSLGFILGLRIKKNLDDEIVKAGLVMNPVAIILGGIQFFI